MDWIKELKTKEGSGEEMKHRNLKEILLKVTIALKKVREIRSRENEERDGE